MKTTQIAIYQIKTQIKNDRMEINLLIQFESFIIIPYLSSPFKLSIFMKI